MKKVERGSRQRLPSDPPSSSGRERVLYIEDNDQNWLVAELRLKLHYRLYRARNDREACEMYRQHREELVAILMDIELHGSLLDGIQLTALFRGRPLPQDLPEYARDLTPSPLIPILFMTAYNAHYPEADLIAAGGNMLIAKPVDFVRLASTLIDLRVDRIVGKPGNRPYHV